MTRNFALIAIAPVTFALAACGGSRETDTADADTTIAEATPTTAAADFPAVATSARTSVEYAGTYNQTGADGRTSTITLNDDDTYTMTGPDGVQSNGTFNWYSDNSRILIKENGQTRVYAIADGALYRMADENAATTGQMTESQTYRRSPPTQVNGNVADVPGE